MELLNKLKCLENNPRIITNEQFESLKQSLKEFLEMLEVREIAYDDDFVIWGGNQRFLAYKALVNDGSVEYDDKYFRKLPSHWTVEQKREFAIKDNSPQGISGSFDDNMLKDHPEWKGLDLEKWGLLTYWKYDDVDVNELWKENNMPDYGNPDLKKPYRTINVHFENQAQVEAFATTINEKITDKTKFIWFK